MSRSRRRGRNDGGREAGDLPENRFGEPSDLLRFVCLFLLVAICVATPLVTSESAVLKGTGIGLILMWLLLAFFWTLSVLAGESKVRAHWIDALPVLLLLVFVASGVVTAGATNFRLSLNMIWLWGSFVVSYLLFRQLVRDGSEQRALVAIMIALSVTMAGFGLYQALYDLPQQRAEFEENPQKMLRAAGIHAPPGSPIRMQFVNRLKSREPFATFALTNSLAGLLAPWTVILVLIGLDRWGRERDEKEATTGWLRGGCFVLLLVVLAACLLLTKSRSALLAIAGGLILSGLWTKRERWLSWRIVAPSLVVLALMLVIGYAIKGLDFQLLTQAGLSLTYRFQYWHSTLLLIQDHWLIGCGPGNFQANYMQYKFPESSESVTDPHNFLLEVWAMVGTAGLVALVGFIACWCRQLSQKPSGDESVEDAESSDGAKVAGLGFGPWAMFAGACFGLFLAYPCGGIAGLTPSWSILLFLPLAAAAIVTLFPWIVGGSLPRHWLLIGWITLSINLLAAGGISFAGVSISWWMLIALGLNQATPGAREVNRAAGWAGMLVAIAVLAFFTQNSLYPIWNANNHALMAQYYSSMGRNSTAKNAYREAAKSDPYSPFPWLRISALAAQHLTPRSDEQRLNEFREAVATLMVLDPKSSGSYRVSGDLNVIVFRATKKREFLDKARQLYERAVALYPSDAMTHARLAWTMHVQGETAAAAKEAGRALELDAQNPHQEKKLARQRLPDPTVSDGPNAEQQMKKLRKTTSSDPS